MLKAFFFVATKLFPKFLVAEESIDDFETVYVDEFVDGFVDRGVVKGVTKGWWTNIIRIVFGSGSSVVIGC